MQQEMEGFIAFVRGELGRGLRSTEDTKSRHAIVRAAPPRLIRVEKSGS
jgi:hypothetical protein